MDEKKEDRKDKFDRIFFSFLCYSRWLQEKNKKNSYKE